jgi:lysophospholipase L1-like esterase
MALLIWAEWVDTNFRLRRYCLQIDIKNPCCQQQRGFLFPAYNRKAIASIIVRFKPWSTIRNPFPYIRPYNMIRKQLPYATVFVYLLLFAGTIFLSSMSLKRSTAFRTSGFVTDTIKAKDSINPVIDSSFAKTYLALGDSYTIGQSVPVKERFPFRTVEMLTNYGYFMKNAEIVATSGWTTTDLLEAIKEKKITKTYDIVSLLIGVNDQYKRKSLVEYRKEFTLLLKKSIKFAGGRPQRVFVLSIPDYSVTPFANHSDRSKIAREIDMFNRENKKISMAFKVNYLNVTAETRKAAYDRTLIAYDDLHFSGKEHGVWANMLAPMVSRVLKSSLSAPTAD